MNSRLDIQKDTELILREISRGRSNNNITMLLCERRGYKWKEAVALIQRVEREHGTEIQKRQLPFQILLCIPLIVLIIIGSILMAGSIYDLLTGVNVPLYFSFFVIEGSFSNGGQLLGLFYGSIMIVVGTFAIYGYLKSIGQLK